MPTTIAIGQGLPALRYLSRWILPCLPFEM